jgi:hypothetical protein
VIVERIRTIPWDTGTAHVGRLAWCRATRDGAVVVTYAGAAQGQRYSPATMPRYFKPRPDLTMIAAAILATKDADHAR